MHHLLLVCGLESQCRLADQFASLGQGQRPQPTHERGEVKALDILGDQKMAVFHLARVVRGDDVGVIQPSDGLHLAMETHQGLRLANPAGCQQLQGYHPLETHMLGAIHHTHRALADLAEQLIVTQAVWQGRGQDEGVAVPTSSASSLPSATGSGFSSRRCRSCTYSVSRRYVVVSSSDSVASTRI